MTMSAEKRHYTYADYLTWPDDERVELIDGIICMSPAPTPTHQRIIRQLLRQIGSYLDDKRCEVLPSPLDVRLFEAEGDDPRATDTVVQPDLMVICDPSKLDERGYRGAPDMIIEILSPSTRRRDRLVKMNLYQRAGVREYWIADPENESVMVFLLGEDGVYHIHEDYGRSDMAQVNILEDCQIDLSRVFPERNDGP